MRKPQCPQYIVDLVVVVLDRPFPLIFSFRIVWTFEDRAVRMVFDWLEDDDAPSGYGDW